MRTEAVPATTELAGEPDVDGGADFERPKRRKAPTAAVATVAAMPAMRPTRLSPGGDGTDGLGGGRSVVLARGSAGRSAAAAWSMSRSGPSASGMRPVGE